MTIRQTAIGHVVLNVRDLKKSVCFYDIFGMILSERNRKNQVVLFRVLGQGALLANVRGHLGRRERGV